MLRREPTTLPVRRVSGERSGLTAGRQTPRVNTDELVAVSVMGQIAHPIGRSTPYRIGYDGVPRVLPGTGGIVLNRRIGDLCVGLAGDHIEPGVALHNNNREVTGPRDGPNNALITYACVGNVARVISGPCNGQLGLVSGKHGGINHVLVDFPTEVLLRLLQRLGNAHARFGLEMPVEIEIDIEVRANRIAQGNAGPPARRSRSPDRR